MIDQFAGSPWHSVLLEVATRTHAYERRSCHDPDDRIRLVDGAHPDRQVDPIFDHISYEIRKNQQLGAQATAMASQDGPVADIVILAFPLRAHTTIGDELSDSIATIVINAIHTDDISPDKLMGILNAAN